MPIWNVSDCYASCEPLLSVRRFVGMFSDGRSRTLVDPCGMCHDTAAGAWEQSRFCICQWCVGIVSPTGLFDMMVICHSNKAVYLRRVYALFHNVCERSTEVQKFDWKRLCCFKPSYDKLYFVRDLVVNWCDVKSER